MYENYGFFSKWTSNTFFWLPFLFEVKHSLIGHLLKLHFLFGTGFHLKQFIQSFMKQKLVQKRIVIVRWVNREAGLKRLFMNLLI